ncbi:hypothetical protein H257_06441 [Aphanomyces astaci]|uniref:Secreted protein n=1 Tax=Aphanomyces astaci TaxID=112090 RepID=W4GNT5_APHAT|nr:hypothetical protein H257_06441 [Aphanomyces astaci]ETV81006.1 hypothetical protein H257_06441 [Aphanomyces astaci]|eukprot:XP_009829953.1 hypothetical protein H257_06441 [Aphanomyces astaci]
MTWSLVSIWLLSVGGLQTLDELRVRELAVSVGVELVQEVPCVARVDVAHVERVPQQSGEFWQLNVPRSVSVGRFERVLHAREQPKHLAMDLLLHVTNDIVMGRM